MKRECAAREQARKHKVKRCLWSACMVPLRSARLRRGALYLIIGAVLSFASAWTVAWVHWWPAWGVVSSERTSHNIVNRWHFSTGSDVLQGAWVPHVNELQRVEYKRFLANVGYAEFSRRLEFATATQRAAQIEADALLKANPSMMICPDPFSYADATYVEMEIARGFPFPCLSTLHSSDRLHRKDQTSSWDALPKVPSWIENGWKTSLGATKGQPARIVQLPLCPWPLGLSLNMLFWAGFPRLAVLKIRRVRKRRLANVGHCVKCSYPLGTSERCPECGISK